MWSISIPSDRVASAATALVGGAPAAYSASMSAIVQTRAAGGAGAWEHAPRASRAADASARGDGLTGPGYARTLDLRKNPRGGSRGGSQFPRVTGIPDDYAGLPSVLAPGFHSTGQRSPVCSAWTRRSVSDTERPSRSALYEACWTTPFGSMMNVARSAMPFSSISAP